MEGGGFAMNIESEQETTPFINNRFVTERWRPIKDFPEYAVSHLGRVKRIVISCRGHHANRILKPHIDKRKLKDGIRIK